MRKGLFKRAKGSIAVTFTLTVVAIFAIAQGSLWMGFLFSQRNFLYEHLNRKVADMSAVVADISARSIKNKNIKDLDFYIERVVSGGEIISVKILDINDRTVAHAAGINESRGASANPFYVPWTNVIETPMSIDGVNIGKVVLVYSGSGVNRDMLNLILLPPIAQFFVFLLIVFSIFFFTNTMLGKPIEVLKDRMTRLTSGDLTVEIPEVGSKEISDVADGLRFLAKGLTLNVQRLMHVTESISGTIVNLKSTFKTAIERVKSQSISTNQIAGSMKLADESQGLMKESAIQLAGSIDENLSSALEIKSREEEILGSLDGLFKSVDGSYTVVAEMSQTSKIMMKNASNVLASVENTSASVEEIIASVREVESSARESSSLADNVRKLAAQKGVVTVDKAIGEMNAISEKVNTAVVIVGRLEKRSKDVQKILAFIKDVTEKTNLLSINASILAEQAGEYGKGFTVVAEQMRSLSTSTEGYTKEISGIVKEIQSEIGEVVKAIDEGREKVKVGSEAVYEVGETMSSILESSHNSANMTKMIERATEDQVLALRHIEKSIIDVNTMAMEMDRAMSEMYTSSGHLFDSMGEVRDVAELTKSGSEELAQGVKSISHNLEQSTVDVKRIEEAISSQKMRSKEILDDVESIRNEGVWIINDLEGLSESIDRLRAEFETLQKEMDTFKVSPK